jgi:hypothetical protein
MYDILIIDNVVVKGVSMNSSSIVRAGFDCRATPGCDVRITGYAVPYSTICRLNPTFTKADPARRTGDVVKLIST